MVTSIHLYPPSPATHKKIEQFFSEHAYPIAERIIAEQEEAENERSQTRRAVKTA